MMAMRDMVAAMVIAIVAVWPAAGFAQEQVDITAPAPARRGPEPMVIPPGDHGQATRPSDADYYPQPPKVRHDPAFIGPMSTKTESARGTRRRGIAGWTSPSTPVGAAQTSHREVSGWFAFGFAYEWDGPPSAQTPAKPRVR